MEPGRPAVNKRDAKRAACKRAASVLETALQGADPDWLGAYGEQGAAMVEAGLWELIAELDRRGQVAQPRQDSAQYGSGPARCGYPVLCRCY
jgi:hypothetical protein